MIRENQKMRVNPRVNSATSIEFDSFVKNIPEEKKRKFRKGLLIILFLLIVAAGLSAYYLFLR